MEYGLHIFYGVPGKSYMRFFNAKLAAQFRAERRSFKDLYRFTYLVDSEDEIDPEASGVPLIRGKKYYLTIDASLTQTGLAIYGEDRKLIAMADVRNDDLTEMDFFAHFGLFLKANFAEVIEKCVIEEALPKRRSFVSKQLTELQGNVLKEMAQCGAELDSILPGVWRKWILKHPKYNGRRSGPEVKNAVRDEVVSRYPEFAQYISDMEAVSKSSQNYVCDSCDAVGIWLGYLEECYVGGNMSKPRVSKTMNNEPRHGITVKYELMDSKLNVITDGTPIPMTEKYKHIIQDRGMRVLYLNDTLTLDDNYRRATSVYNELLLMLPTNDAQITALQWEIGRRVDNIAEGQIAVGIVYNTNKTAKQPLKEFIARIPVM